MEVQIPGLTPGANIGRAYGASSGHIGFYSRAEEQEREQE
jgi:hypothetical protein